MGIIDSAKRYSELGLHLVAIKEGQKGPSTANWHLEGIDISKLRENQNIGVIHNISGTCSIDIDNREDAITVFKFLGLDPVEMKNLYPCYRGKEEGIKFLFKMPDIAHIGIKKLAYKRGDEVITVFELRGSTSGHGCQDLLPPSLHPSGVRYRWIKEPPSQFSDLPELPMRLQELWKNFDVEEKQLLNCLGQFKPDPIKPKLEPKLDSVDVIERFNSTYSVENILTKNGYIQKGDNRFLSPHSSTKTPGLVLLEDGTIYSHHASDRLLSDGHSHDAFDLLRILEANGDWKTAFNSARTDLGMPVVNYKKPMDERAFKFFHASESLKRAQPPKWVIKGVCEEDALVGIFGPPKSGKSFVTIDMACCIATGTEWHERRTKEGLVLYICGEGTRSMANRLLAWETVNNLSLKDSKLHISERGVQMLDDLDAQMMRDEALVIQDLYKEPPKLVIIDTVARNFLGNENSTEDMNRFISGVDKWIRQEFKCAVILVHHTGYGNNNRGRGSSSLPAALDWEYSVTKHGELDNWHLDFEQTLIKDGRPLAPMSFQFTETVFHHLTDEDGTPTTSGALQTRIYSKPDDQILSSTQQELLDDFLAVFKRKIYKVREDDGDITEVLVTQEELREKVDGRLNSNQLNKIKRKLLEKKIIHDKGGKGYDLNDEMKAVF